MQGVDGLAVTECVRRCVVNDECLLLCGLTCGLVTDAAALPPPNTESSLDSAMQG
jgi:hypothetical protein